MDAEQRRPEMRTAESGGPRTAPPFAIPLGDPAAELLAEFCARLDPAALARAEPEARTAASGVEAPAEEAPAADPRREAMVELARRLDAALGGRPTDRDLAVCLDALCAYAERLALPAQASDAPLTAPEALRRFGSAEPRAGARPCEVPPCGSGAEPEPAALPAPLQGALAAVALARGWDARRLDAGAWAAAQPGAPGFARAWLSGARLEEIGLAAAQDVDGDRAFLAEAAAVARRL